MLVTVIIFLSLIIFFTFIVYLRLRRPIEEDNEIVSEGHGLEILEIKTSKLSASDGEVNNSALSAENMFAALHGLLKEDTDLQEQISFEMVASGTRGIRFYVTAPSGIIKFIESQIYAQYSDAQISVVEDYVSSINPKHSKFQIASLILENEEFFPIKTFRDFEIDPLSSLSSAVSGLHLGEEVWFQIIIKPTPDVWQEDGFSYVEAIKSGEDSDDNSFIKFFTKTVRNEVLGLAHGSAVGLFTYREPTDEGLGSDSSSTRLTSSQENDLKLIEGKLSKMGFSTTIRLVSAAENATRVESNLRAAMASFRQFSTLTLNKFSHVVEKDNERSLNNYANRVFEPDRASLLNTEELGTLFHFPSSNLDTPNISWTYSRKSEPPTNLPTEDCVYIGKTLYRNKEVPFGLSSKNQDDRLRHMYIIGKSGTGKSTLLTTMMTQDIMNGEGVGILDPHGETIDLILDRIPDNRIEDVIYFDPSDSEFPLGLNLMELEDPSQKNLMASGLVAAIREHFEYSWGPRLEYLLNYSILTLLDVPGTTMLGITRLLEDKNYLNFILHQVKDPMVKRFWEQEYKNLSGNQKFVTEAIAPIQNKVNRFLASTTIRNILGQGKSTFDLWNAMNDGKIILMNLTKGKIGADNANLLGALLVSRLQFYALQRAKIPYNERRPFYLYVDEFQNFATGSFEEILSESRKYKLGLYLTHQFTAQLPETLQDAVFGNVGTIVSFSIGAPDAKVMENEFVPYFEADDLITLERFQIYIKLMIDGMTSLPFSGRILVPWEGDFMVPKTDNKEKVIQRSREKYGVDREYVEDKVAKWLTTKFDKGMAIAQEYKSKNKSADPADSSNLKETKND